MTAGLWEPVDRTNPVVDAGGAQLPRVFWGRPELWKDLLALVDTTASHPETWGFLAEMVNATKAKVIVEAGTYRGHACLAMAEALWCAKQEGHIWSADIEDHHVGDVLEQTDLRDYVTLCLGDFKRMVEEYVTEPIDLAFVDASDPDNALLRVETVAFLVPRMRKGGIIVVDDCANDEWPAAASLREYCNLYLPLGRGTCVFQT